MATVRATYTPNAPSASSAAGHHASGRSQRRRFARLCRSQCSSAHAQSVANQVSLPRVYCPHASLSQAFACGQTQAETVRLNVFFLRLVCGLPDPTYFATLFHGCFLGLP